ncbi:dihydrodipicolinate synthase [Micractinium conductrix]|uniref:4-hydroxy-tetrahydrodipicolinate synthase n=1 Tax=Micractinium conductrix TaxID=554055 RepID=A0A2P6VKU0_9CHLO|nr:dihydrodipicolinate synthase [Micractinium conductrix]|eukprot:PSC74721.1 dihydrodipicolinate synthase [Micractinium conductrix]
MVQSASCACAGRVAPATAGRRRAERRRAAVARPVAVLAPLQDPAAAENATAVLKKLRLITAIKTPYLTNGKFDLNAYDALVEAQIQNGVEGLIVGGTTGEGQLMSWDEHIMLIAHTVNQFGRQVKVIGNTGSNSTREALHATEQGFAVGMDAALQINPYYGKTSMIGLRQHFKAALAEGPAIIYNVPGRTGQDIPSDLILELAAHENFLGVKECTGNPRIADYHSQGVLCWSGNDDEAHAGRHQHHAQGVISVTSNVIPGLFSKLMTQRDDELAGSLGELISWLFCEPNPIPLNTALAMCGLVKPVFRLPYVPLSHEQRERGALLLRAVQQHIPGCKEVRVMEDSEFKLVASSSY